jgi:magnesium transporter
MQEQGQIDQVEKEELESTISKAGNLMNSKTSHLDDILQEKLEKAFHKETSKVSLHDMNKIALEHSAIDLAYAASHLPLTARPVLYDSLPNPDSKMQFVINTDSDTRVTIFRYMSDHEMQKLFNKMPTEDAVKVLEDMSERRFRRVMEFIDPKKAATVKELKKHQRNSAGRLMTTEFFAFPMNMTLGEAARYVRDYPNIEFTRGIYIVNQEQELLGYVPGRNLIINPPHIPLRQVMRPILHKVSPDATREEVVDIVERYKISSLPVVDGDSKLLGVVTHEDVVEVMEDLADETLARIAGTAAKVSFNQPVLRRFISRSPWLFVTLIAGLLNVVIMSFFQKQDIGILTMILFFVPLITGMSGNIGIQCSTVLVRGMAIGVLSSGSKKEALTKELFVGFFTGGFFGCIVGVIIYAICLWIGKEPGFSALLGFVVGSGFIGACFTGTFLGVCSPLFFAKLGVDPAIASGPIVTAFNDVLSMSVYFLIAWGLGTLLLC